LWLIIILICVTFSVFDAFLALMEETLIEKYKLSISTSTVLVSVSVLITFVLGSVSSFINGHYFLGKYGYFLIIALLLASSFVSLLTFYPSQYSVTVPWIGVFGLLCCLQYWVGIGIGSLNLLSPLNFITLANSIVMASAYALDILVSIFYGYLRDVTNTWDYSLGIFCGFLYIGTICAVMLTVIDYYKHGPLTHKVDESSLTVL